MQSRNANNLKGIDVSHYQGNIDFGKVKADGIDIVYIKATEGITKVDQKVQQNYIDAKAAGLKIGFYHFFRGNTEEKAKQEAQFFTNIIKYSQHDCKCMLDIETTQKLDKDTLSKLAKVFIEEVKRLTGEDAVIYTYASFAENNLTDVLAEYPLWVAHYGVNNPGDNPIWDSWIGFQYTSSGAVNGITGNVDMDEFTTDIFIGSASIPAKTISKQVSYIQSTLNSRYGFKLWVDNIAGKHTFEGIYAALQIELNKQFNKGLVVDGIPGPKTLNAVVTLKKGAQGNLVWLLQALLICKGRSVGPTGADSHFGNYTFIAVQHFQSANGLVSDGSVGPKTWEKLLGL